MRKVLDKLYGNARLSILISCLLTALAILLFAVFGPAKDKMTEVAVAVLVSAVCFFGCFGVIFFQVENELCPDWFLNLFELMATIFFAYGAIWQTVTFIGCGFQSLPAPLCIAFMTHGAIAWAHSKRVVE